MTAQLAPSPLPTPGLPVTPPSPPTPSTAPAGFSALGRELLAVFRSVQLAILLLSLLAVGIVVGVLMPQEGLVEIVNIRRQFGTNYPLLKSLGLFNVFSSYWFITLQALFFFNLLLGSFRWLKPAIQAATRVQFFTTPQIRRAEAAFDVPTVEMSAWTKLLRRRGYRVHLDPACAQRGYATLGHWTRFGPAMAHTGILLMLLASLFGTFTGFKAQRLAVPGDTFSLLEANVFTPNIAPPFWLGSVPDWKVRVRDFRVVFYKDAPETPQQFYADLDLLSADGKTLLERKTIAVNHPLSHGDLTIYQAAYEPTGRLMLTVNGQRRIVEVNTQFQSRPISLTPLGDGRDLVVFPFFVQKDPGVTENHIVAFLRKGNGFIGGAKGKMPPNARLAVGQEGRLADLTIRYDRPEIATGLQIKKAPEVPWMILSYAIICLGALMCIPSQRQLWFDGSAGRLWVLPKTNKGRVTFQQECARLQADAQPLAAKTSPSVSVTERAG